MIKRKPIKLGIASYLIIVAKTHALLGAQNVFFLYLVIGVCQHDKKEQYRRHKHCPL